MKVVVACPEPTMREVLGEMLKEFGHEPIGFDSGLDVWTAFEEGMKVDLLIVDQYLAYMSGEQLLLYVKENPKLKLLPVIVMSGLLYPADIERLTEFGAHTVMSKPIRLAQFKKAIANALAS